MTPTIQGDKLASPGTEKVEQQRCEDRKLTPPLEFLPVEWRASWPAFKSNSARDFVKYCIANQVAPDDVREGDFERFVIASGAAGSIYRATTIRQECKRSIVDAGLEASFAYLDFRRYQPWWCFGLPLTLFPQPLQNILMQLLQMKIQDGGIRIISAHALEVLFARLQGYVVKVWKQPARTSIADLVSRDVVVRYIKWYITDRIPLNRKTYLKRDLRMLYAAVTSFPATKNLDWEWFAELLPTIPYPTRKERESRRRSRSVRPETVDTLLSRLGDRVRRELSNAERG